MVAGRAGKNKIKNGRKSDNLFLGVDGGGTKTLVVLLDGESNVIAEGLSGASNPMRVGIEKAVTNISEAVNNACDKSNRNPTDIVAAALGLAGVRRNDIRLRVRERISRMLGTKFVEVVTDADIALYGAVKDKTGLVVIAGTGSICLGKNEKGEKGIAGGWGPLAGDEGGGAGIARRALQAIAKASDGRGSSTKLSQKAMEYFRAGKPEDLLVAIYAPQIDNTRIAGFAKFVSEAAAEGDEVSKQILAEAGYELGLAATAVIRQLKLQKRKFPIAIVGSIFQSGQIITRPLIETVAKTAPKAYLIEPPLPPAVAAAQMAFEICRNEKSLRKL
ncbi:MAG: BadF/BadG/BcrA/BcrD ATPase family protein [Acidobacteriota bacterium]